MDNDDFGGCIVAVGGLVVALVVLYVVVFWVIPVIIGLGAAFGGIVATKNYGESFLTNVRAETDPNGIVAKCLVGLIGAALAAGVVALVIQFTN